MKKVVELSVQKLREKVRKTMTLNIYSSIITVSTGLIKELSHLLQKKKGAHKIYDALMSAFVQQDSYLARG